MTNKPRDDRQTERAIYWHVRLLSGDFNAKELDEFIAWQQAAPGNEARLRYVSENWTDLKLDDTALRGIMGPRTEGKTWSRRLAGVVAGALLIGVGLLYGLSSFGEKHITARGEQKTIYLAEGSSVSLNTDSEITVDMGTHVRAVTLVRGEAYFQVTPDKTRPFTVDVGRRTVRVVGTAFNIFRKADHSVLSVTEGVVVILGQGSDVDRHFVAGEQVIIDQANRLMEKTEFDPARVVAWREGQLVFDDIPLRDFVTDLNRYYSGKVILQGRELGDLRLSGVFQIGDRDRTIKAVEDLLSLKTEKLATNNIIIYRE